MKAVAEIFLIYIYIYISIYIYIYVYIHNTSILLFNIESSITLKERAMYK